MLLTYDPTYDIAYLRLNEPRKVVETLNVRDDLNIDLGTDGTVYGIEFLNAATQLGLKKLGGSPPSNAQR